MVLTAIRGREAGLSWRALRCTRCGRREAAIRLHYSGESLCVRCFTDRLEGRVRTAIGRYDMLRPDDRIAVALSGGKDSLSLLYVLARVERDYPEAELLAITVDEGIGAHRAEGVEQASRLCARLGVEHVVVSFRELYGATLPEMLKAIERRPGALDPCAYCGVLRRRAVNQVARDEGATVVAVAHNLDDMVQAWLMNLLRNNLPRLVRFRPTTRARHPRLITRVRPFCLVPERETAFYAFLHGFHGPRTPCPYARRALRNEIRVFLNRLEQRHPGTKFALYRAFERLLPALEASLPRGSLRECERCGEPSSGRLCKVCEFLEQAGLA